MLVYCCAIDKARPDLCRFVTFRSFGCRRCNVQLKYTYTNCIHLCRQEQKLLGTKTNAFYFDRNSIILDCNEAYHELLLLMDD